MLLREVVDCSAEVRSTRSRLAKTSAIAGLLGRAEPELVPTVASYLSGELPQGKIGVGYALLYGLDEPAAADPSLTVEHVDRVLTELKAISGAGSKQRRVDILTTLLGAATDAEQDFLRNLIIGELRQGASGGIMEEAVAQAAGVPVGLVRRAAMLNGDLAPVARAALSDGADGLSAFALEVFSPLQPMLAQSAESAAAALERTGPAAVEYKIDGARIQVHHQAGKTQVFSRNLRDVTSQVPNVGEVLAGLGIDSCILDGEAIAVGRSGRPEPFQESMSRFGRQSSGGPLAAYFFDCLHLNGTDLIDEPTPVRAQALAGALPGGLIAPRIETDSAQEATAFFEQAVADGFEGVMVKALYAPYEAGRRGAAWVKVKPVHTLDLVVLAVEWGSGRRQGWLSNLHLGARDPESESFVMLGKTFKGLTDDLLTWQTERFLELETHRDGRTVYVRPEQVVEIAFDGVQRSSRYPGGVALRFARVKGYRDDKDAADADTIETVRGFV